MSIYALIILAYFVLVVILGFLTKKTASKSVAEFLVAGRNLGIIVCAVVVSAEWLGGMSTIGVSEKAFKTGSLQPIFYNISTAVGMIIIGFTVAAHYRRKSVHTVSEMIESIFGSSAKTISALAFLIAYIILTYVQLQTCSSVIAPLFNINWIWAVLISSVIITIYTYFGGMHALAITGIVYLVTMYVGLGAAFIIGLFKVGGFGPLRDVLIAKGAPVNMYNPFSAGVSDAFALLLGGVLGGMAAQASIQPIFSARNVKTAKWSSVLAGLIVAPFGLMAAFLALYAKTGLFFDTTNVKANEILPTLLQTPSFIHPVLGGIALAGVLAAILSTVGPVNFAVVTIAAKDIYHGIINKNAEDKKVVSTAKKLVILVNIITVPLAILLRGGILDTAYVSYAIRAIGAIVILMGIYAKGWITPLGVKLSFILGTIVVFLTIVAKQLGIFTVDKTYSAVVTTIVIIAVSTILDKLFSKKTAK
ncbi:sodium:solute symporter family protein [candidate division WOR-3 bacterium]|nr:sodium:solute symporter family protein [candidate division WOR-3 bacterium]